MMKQNYANVYWTIDDVMEKSKQFGIQIKRDEAKNVLAAKERHIADAMISAGWEVIEGALLQNRSTKEFRNS